MKSKSIVGIIGGAGIAATNKLLEQINSYFRVDFHDPRWGDSTEILEKTIIKNLRRLEV